VENKMSNRYNIYKLKSKQFDNLREKIDKEGLVEQKSKEIDGYRLIFYFSEDIDGNPIWWYETYKNFFKDGLKEPRNIFYFGLLVVEKIDDKNIIFLVSLGKSHFYLNKFIERNFGINIAIRIAKEQTMVLKKSRLFGGIKRQEITSYIEFEIDNYEAGESVEHLKLKAYDQELWGDKNIIFADSIQIDFEHEPEDMVPMFKEIENQLSISPLIELPKLEIVDEPEIISALDLSLVEQVLKSDQDLKIEEFTLYGVVFCFNYLNYDYQIYYLHERKHDHIQDLGNNISINDIKTILLKLGDSYDINNIKVRFSYGEKGQFTKSLKEILDCHIDYRETSYFLRDGEWFSFNQKFMEYLKRSLTQIEVEITDPFLESEYLEWKEKKENEIESGVADNKLTYREYYFNLSKSQTEDYILMDRENEEINSLNNKRKNYQIEIADLYKDKTVWAVKIGNEKEKIIYNIEQSKDSIELLTRKVVSTTYDIDNFGLWFVLEEDVKSLFEINSIQLLLAIESWKRKVEFYGCKPLFRITKLEKNCD
jgi:uncharacterized protein (TIGR04141 family)